METLVLQLIVRWIVVLVFNDLTPDLCFHGNWLMGRRVLGWGKYAYPVCLAKSKKLGWNQQNKKQQNKKQQELKRACVPRAGLVSI